MAKIATSIEQFQKKHFGKDATPYIKLEARIINTFLHALVQQGYSLTGVNDGDEVHVIKDNNPFAALERIFTVDQAELLLKTPAGNVIEPMLVLGEGDTQPITQCSGEYESDYEPLMDIFKQAVKKESEFHYDTHWA